MSTRERSARDELLRQQQQLKQQEAAREWERAASLDQIAWEMQRLATGQSWGALWPPDGAPGPGMRF